LLIEYFNKYKDNKLEQKFIRNPAYRKTTTKFPVITENSSFDDIAKIAISDDIENLAVHKIAAEQNAAATGSAIASSATGPASASSATGPASASASSTSTTTHPLFNVNDRVKYEHLNYTVVSVDPTTLKYTIQNDIGKKTFDIHHNELSPGGDSKENLAPRSALVNRTLVEATLGKRLGKSISYRGQPQVTPRGTGQSTGTGQQPEPPAETGTGQQPEPPAATGTATGQSTQPEPPPVTVQSTGTGQSTQPPAATGQSTGTVQQPATQPPAGAPRLQIANFTPGERVHYKNIRKNIDKEVTIQSCSMFGCTVLNDDETTETRVDPKFLLKLV
jgi:hypothetical protein